MNKKRRLSNRPLHSKRLHRKRVKPIPRQHKDYAAGISEGTAWRRSAAYDTSPERLREVVHQRWSRRFNGTSRVKSSVWKLVQQSGTKYAAGFMKGAGLYASLSTVPIRNKAAAVVFAGSEAAALQKVLLQLEALPLHEIVIVLSNPSDVTYSIAKFHKKAVIAYLPDKIDPDVGRALGAKLTNADTVLFVDGEQAVDSNSLARFLWECDGKLDVALNDVTAKMGLFQKRSSSSWFGEFLNASLNREDLRTNSLSALPFAVSRYALDMLGPAALSLPVKAHALAILNGLRIGTGGFVRSRAIQETSDSDGKWKKAAGDHVEAWREAMSAKGSRLNFADSIRNRSVLGDWDR